MAEDEQKNDQENSLNSDEPLAKVQAEERKSNNADADGDDGDESETGSSKVEDREPNPEDRGVDKDSKCPECGEPIENVRTSCSNCGYEYKDEDYTDEEAGTAFRAGTAIDEHGEEKDVTGDVEADKEDDGDASADEGDTSADQDDDGASDDSDDDDDTSEGTSEGTSDDEEEEDDNAS